MKLYFSPGACSLSPHIALREAGLEFDLVKVDLKTHQTEDGGDYYQINSKGYVPALELNNGVRLTENPAIVQYIADQNPGSKLAPANGTLERYQLQEWLGYIGSEIHKTMGALFHAGMSDEAKKITIDRVLQRFEYVNQQLEQRNFLVNENFSVADCYLFVMLSWTGFLKLDISRFEALQNFQKRVYARPAVQAAMKAEGLLK